MNKSKSWQIMVHFSRIKSDKEKHPQINHVEETDNVKWCVLKSLSIVKCRDNKFICTWIVSFDVLFCNRI